MYCAQNVLQGFPDVKIGAPPGKENEVAALPAAVGTHKDGSPLIVSRWKPTPEERAAIAAGDDIYLYAFSGVMIPVMITTDKPIAVTTDFPPVILTPDHRDYRTWAMPPGIGG